MYKKAKNTEFNRLKSLLIHDKANAPNQLSDVLKSDLYSMLKNYMDITPDDIQIFFDADEKGNHVIISARTNRFKHMGTLPKPYK